MATQSQIEATCNYTDEMSEDADCAGAERTA